MKQVPHGTAHTHHAKHDAAGGNDGPHAHLDNFFKRKFKSERKHQEDYAMSAQVCMLSMLLTEGV